MFIDLFNREKKLDIVMLAYHHSKAGLCSLSSEERIHVLCELKKKCNKIVWLDTADGTGTCFFDVLPYVDVYLKKQLLIGDNAYQSEIWSNRVFGEYYHQTLGIQDTGQKENIRYYSILDTKYINKVGISWNVGLGDLHTVGLKRYVYRNHYAPVVFVPPSLNKRFDIHYRGSSYPDAIGYQRVHTRELLANRTDIITPDVNTRVPHKEYVDESKNSLAIMSPFGFGEICGRDFEAFLFGVALIKPNMSHLKTYPDVYKENQTYISIEWDFSNFDKVIDMFQRDDGRKHILEIAHSGQNLYKQYLKNVEKKQEFAWHIISQIEK